MYYDSPGIPFIGYLFAIALALVPVYIAMLLYKLPDKLIRPYMVPFIEISIDGQKPYLTIKNFGKHSCVITKMASSIDLSRIQSDGAIVSLENLVGVDFAPEQSISIELSQDKIDAFIHEQEKMKLSKPYTFKVEIQYQANKYKGEIYSERASVSFRK